MSNPGHESFPDLDISGVLPPSAETLSNFEVTLVQLYERADATHTRSVEAHLEGPSQEAVQIYCNQATDTRPSEPARVSHVLTVAIADAERGNMHVLGYGHNAPKDAAQTRVESILSKVSAGLDAEQTRWLDAVVAEARAGREPLPEVIEDLLDRAPFPTNVCTTRNLRQVFNSGATVFAHWLEASDSFWSSCPPAQPKRTVDVSTADGATYEYKQLVDGSSRLFIWRAGQETANQTTTEGFPACITPEGLSVSFFGQHEVLAAAHRGAARRQEARKSGADFLTERSLAEITSVLQGAMRSGVVLPEAPGAK